MTHPLVRHFTNSANSPRYFDSPMVFTRSPPLSVTLSVANERGANLDASLWPNVKTHPHRRRAKGLAGGRPIAVDNKNRLTLTQGDQPPPGLDQLIGAKAILGMGIFTHRPIKVVPNVHHTLFYQLLEILLGEDLVDVFAGDGAGDAKEDAPFFEPFHAFEGRVMDTLAPALVVAFFQAVDGDERGDISQLKQSVRIPFGKEHAVGYGLEITIGVPFHGFPDSFVHVGFAAQKGVIVGLHALAGFDDGIEFTGGIWWAVPSFSTQQP